MITYKILPGDSLSKIKKKLGIVASIDDIVKANPIIKDPNKIQIGWSLILPERYDEIKAVRKTIPELKVTKEFIPEKQKIEMINIIAKDINLDQMKLDRFTQTGQKPYPDWNSQIVQSAVDNFKEVSKYLRGIPVTKTVTEMLKGLQIARQGHTDAINWLSEHPKDVNILGNKAWHEEWIKHYEDMEIMIRETQRMKTLKSFKR